MFVCVVLCASLCVLACYQRFPEVANKCVCELVEEESICYLDDSYLGYCCAS